ncbi:hypothetical protein WJ0W_007093 [Paenibacillus melissococcoides]|uniref:Mor transcription activator domain-containing protein n=1 Tax=Paenibacillus melissococcoides TaxID=2912268 RepID=A0ABN8UHP0_9BACL|nr:Mor transcription activator family protein [Paenibacillus melissococcoides]CAH8249907.1 hypothetical protein WJ0W_007093 [Paenibacillus melissococcoides]CAH8718536.1 hypothetical protein WDD9_005242 [Paenibacillus melissococcoides]CAH8721858.1 hypothetical protein HTL2_006571 [Paenibacillus melissococcoides]CAH8721963.1 hypothetical protein WDD9_006551 [Paenibacillus melissococcoides]
MEWLDELTPDMLPMPYRKYAEWIGLDNLITLASKAGGDHVYIPTLDFFFRRVRDRRIIQEYDGYNHREIAQKYELSERRVREICDGILPVTPRRDENQLQLFDDDELK